MTRTAASAGAPAYSAADIPQRLDGLVAALGAPRERIESAFLDVGARLGDASTLLNRIVAAFEALPRDLESPQMTEAIERLGNFAGHTREISEAFSAERQDVGRLVDAVDAATHPIGDLRRSVKMMGILAINARIVAAGLNGDADHFAVFTTDIANLAKGASTAIAAFSEGHQQLAAAVESAAGQFSAFEAAHHDTLVNLAASLENGLAEVAARRDTSASRSAETARISRAVSMRVASAVMALQVGDATRQRVQHVEEGLAALAGWGRGESVAGIAVAAPELGSLLPLVLGLEQAQLGDTIGSFNDETAEAERALVELAADAEAAVADCRKLYGGGSGGSSLAALGTEMRRAAALLLECDSERGRLGRMAVAVDGTVEVLVGHVEAVQEIEANMRLVGLNAAVKCAQLGPRGAALSVIATQLRALTSDLVTAARAAILRLEEATTAARAFTAASTGKLAAELGRLEAEAMDSIGLLEEVDGRLTQALKTLGRDGPEATVRLAAASRGLGGHVALAETLSDAHIELAGLAASCAADGTNADPARLAPVFTQLRRGYSMDSERRIHDRLVGTAPVDAAATESAADDDILLF